MFLVWLFLVIKNLVWFIFHCLNLVWYALIWSALLVCADLVYYMVYYMVCIWRWSWLFWDQSKKNQKKSLWHIDFYFLIMYNNSKAKQRTTKTNAPQPGRKESMKMNNAELVKKYQKIALRFWRRERYILSLDLHDPERHQRWYELRKERNRRFLSLHRELLERGIEPNFIPIFK